MRFTTGQRIGRYVIESLLGEGGMGEVYRARDSRLERSVALKVLRNEAEGSSEDWDHAVLRMQREAQAVAALSHPGIVAIYDIGEHESIPFIAMELVGGQPLRDLIGKDPQRATNLRILLDVARALGAAHEAGFVHRDIKPENILVRQDGIAKILDFGIARKTSLNAERSGQTLDVQGTTIDAALVGMTAEGAIVGTPAYMSPEQLRGETADARSDQFAWGVVAYELLSGRHPFHAEKGAIGLLSAILGETPAPLEGLPAGVAEVVMRTLEKEPEKRWASMQEIATHWESFVTNGDSRKLPIVAPSEPEVSPSQTANASATVRRPRARWVIAPIVALAALTAVVAFAFRERPAPVVNPVVLPSAAPAAPTAVTDLLIPASGNTAAIAEFRQGLQNIRDARWTAAAMAFQHARTADPGMAAAHLRYSIIQFSYDQTTAREAYRKAHGLRASLTERDQDFLQALEPIILREPSDYVEGAKRMKALSERYPMDAELTFWYSRLLYHSSSTPETVQRVIELNDRCIQLDPHYADCWQTKAGALSMSGRVEEATKTLDECFRVSENAVDCLIDKIDLDSQLGRCDTVIESAQKLKTKDPFALNGHLLLAGALFVAGRDESVVRAAFDEAAKRSQEGGRKYEHRRILLVGHVNYGEFNEALEQTDQLLHSLTAPNVETENGVFITRAQIFFELGKYAEAAKVADEYFVARTLRPNSLKSQQGDMTVLMNALRYRAGKINRSEYQTVRTEWLSQHPARTNFDRAMGWLVAYAIPAFSRELAQEALDNVPKDLAEFPTDLLRFSKPFAAFHGRSLVLVGRHAEAIPKLEDSLKICTHSEAPVWNTQNIAYLGNAYEATGNKAEACKQYGRVLARWGKSKQSLTVKEVNKQVKKLGCESTAGQGTP